MQTNIRQHRWIDTLRKPYIEIDHHNNQDQYEQEPKTTMESVIDNNVKKLA